MILKMWVCYIQLFHRIFNKAHYVDVCLKHKILAVSCAYG